jgi:hypothetical protein
MTFQFWSSPRCILYQLRLTPTYCKLERQNTVCIVCTVHRTEGKKWDLQQREAIPERGKSPVCRDAEVQEHGSDMPLNRWPARQSERRRTTRGWWLNCTSGVLTSRCPARARTAAPVCVGGPVSTRKLEPPPSSADPQPGCRRRALLPPMSSSRSRPPPSALPTPGSPPRCPLPQHCSSRRPSGSACGGVARKAAAEDESTRKRTWRGRSEMVVGWRSTTMVSG